MSRKFSKRDFIEAVIDVLRGLESGDSPEIRCEGLCDLFEVQMIGYNNYKVGLKGVFRECGYHLYTGDHEFPVPAPTKVGSINLFAGGPIDPAEYPERAFFLVKNLWSGEYGDDRRSLCGAVADWFEEYIDDLI